LAKSVASVRPHAVTNKVVIAIAAIAADAIAGIGRNLANSMPVLRLYQVAVGDVQPGWLRRVG
jgi:hypothetical protein